MTILLERLRLLAEGYGSRLKICDSSCHAGYYEISIGPHTYISISLDDDALGDAFFSIGARLYHDRLEEEKKSKPATEI